MSESDFINNPSYEDTMLIIDPNSIELTPELLEYIGKIDKLIFIQDYMPVPLYARVNYCHLSEEGWSWWRWFVRNQRWTYKHSKSGKIIRRKSKWYNVCIELEKRGY